MMSFLNMHVLSFLLLQILLIKLLWFTEFYIQSLKLNSDQFVKFNMAILHFHYRPSLFF